MDIAQAVALARRQRPHSLGVGVEIALEALRQEQSATSTLYWLMEAGYDLDECYDIVAQASDAMEAG